MKCHRSISGQKHFKKKMWVFSWHCHSMKSLRRMTLLVRMNISSGGQSAVYIWLLIVLTVIDSGSFNATVLPFFWGVVWGESGFKVVVEDTESSTSDLAPGSGEDSRSDVEEPDRISWLDRIVCVILACEKEAAAGSGGVVYSSTVALIAAVISAREVYGKQMLRTALDMLSARPGTQHPGFKTILFVVFRHLDCPVDKRQHVGGN